MPRSEVGDAVYGLIGRTLGHSWSVPIHRALGNGGYRLLELEPEELAACLARPEIMGLNVTIPYKRAVMPLCGAVDDAAREIGSVNTLVRRGGVLHGYNTDAAGFCFMARRAGIAFRGRKVLILGSGGASLTASACVRRLGAREVTVLSRSGPDNYGSLARHADAQILINATPVGMYPRVGAAAVDLTAFPACEGVLDLIYNPLRTALLLQAEALGLPRSNGLPMLVAQAAEAEALFFGGEIGEARVDQVLKNLVRERENLVLVGMPGCGKSTVGALLAELAGREAVDVDAGIAARAGAPIPAIFAREGEAAFRAMEREETARAGMESGKILITGGGAVKTPANRAALRQNGRVYHLLRDVTRLSRDGRPLSRGADLAAMWAERAPLYREFRDVEIDNNGAPQEAARAIWEEFCEYFSAERP